MRIFAALFAGFLFVSMLSMGCTKSTPTSVDTVRVTDTLNRHDTLTHRDTVRTGPAFVRFLAFLNSSQTVTLQRSDGASFIPFASAPSQSTRQYLPIRGDTALNLTGSFFDTTALISGQPILIPAFGAGTLVTVALFEVPGPSLAEVFKSDPIDPPPPGFGYLRIINACADFPTPHDVIEAWLDNLSSQPLLADASTHAAKYLTYRDVSDYVLVPVGAHTLLIKGDAGSTADYSVPLNVSDGGYYTARFIGLRTMGTDKVIVDVE